MQMEVDHANEEEKIARETAPDMIRASDISA